MASPLYFLVCLMVASVFIGDVKSAPTGSNVALSAAPEVTATRVTEPGLTEPGVTESGVVSPVEVRFALPSKDSSKNKNRFATSWMTSNWSGNHEYEDDKVFFPGQALPHPLPEDGGLPQVLFPFPEADQVNFSPLPQDCNCPFGNDFNPVCGSDGVSYRNPRHLECARRCGKPSLRVKHEGACEVVRP